MFNDAMNPDSGAEKKKEKKERKKEKKKITAMCFLPRPAGSTPMSPPSPLLIPAAPLSGLVVVCRVPGPPLPSISFPRATHVLFTALSN